jgi:ABC-type transport system involved in cytochrome bd biosynthesis fused ATPase/permease subunit
VDRIILPILSVVTLIIGLTIGVLLGSVLGRVGSLQILSFILRIPIILIKSPKELKSKWKMWRELRGSRKIELLKRQKEIKALEEKITGHKKEIKKIKAQIRRIKWEFGEPVSKKEA